MPASTRIRFGGPWTVVLVLAAAATGGLLLCRQARPSNADPVPAIPADAVARVGDAFLTVHDVQAAARRRSGGIAISNALENLIRRELYAQEALRTGFADREEVREAWRSFLAHRYEETRQADRSRAPALTDQELAAHLDAHPEAYRSPERRRLALLVLPADAAPAPDSGGADPVIALREQAVNEAREHPGFGDLAARHSTHRPSRASGGDVGWVTRDQAGRAWPLEVAAAAFTLSQPGEISPPIRTPEGCYLVKLMDSQPPQVPPLERVRERVRHDLTRNREALAAEAAMAELRSRHPVEVYSQRLADVRPSGDSAGSMPRLASRPPSLPAP